MTSEARTQWVREEVGRQGQWSQVATRTTTASGQLCPVGWAWLPKTFRSGLAQRTPPQTHASHQVSQQGRPGQAWGGQSGRERGLGLASKPKDRRTVFLDARLLGWPEGLVEIRGECTFSQATPRPSHGSGKSWRPQKPPEAPCCCVWEALRVEALTCPLHCGSGRAELGVGGPPLPPSGAGSRVPPGRPWGSSQPPRPHPCPNPVLWGFPSPAARLSDGSNKENFKATSWTRSRERVSARITANSSVGL